MLLTVFRKAFSVCLLLVLGWALYFYGLGRVQSESTTGYKSANRLLVMAEKSERVETSESLAKQALLQDPTHGGAASFLLALYIAENRSTETASLAELSAHLWPVDVYTHSRLADYWISEGRIDKLIPELNILLVREGGWRRRLFPVLQALIVNSGQVDLLSLYIAKPPVWWDSFFAYIAKSVDREIMLDIYQRRLDSTVVLSESETSSIVSRLIKDKRWQSAFEHWKRGLDPTQAALISNGLFDGGFEGELPQKAFGWNIKRNKAHRIQVRNTYGATGKKALQLSFKQGLNRIAFKHLSQRLLLKPGRYEMKYRVRADALKNPKGLRWRVSCETSKKDVLGESKPLLGRHQWKSLSFAFQVPRSCEVQSLQLEAVSRFPHEHVFNGTLWLDDIEVIPASDGHQ